MIPAHDPSTGNLPAGEHLAQWAAVVERFGTTLWRRQLLEGLAHALRDLRAAGCKRAYSDGSVVDTEDHRGDFDACWDLDDVDFDVIDEVLLTFDTGRGAQKARYRGELFPADAAADPLCTLFRDFFQRDRDGNRKGIIVIDLESFG
ncbi:MAG: hypothetical protein ABI277_14780 [Burkholderiaceae bacterium]